MFWINATIHKSVYTFVWLQRSPKLLFWRDVPSIFGRTSPSSFLIFSFHFETPRISCNQLLGASFAPPSSISICCIVRADHTRAVINLVDKAFQVYCFCYFSLSNNLTSYSYNLAVIIRAQRTTRWARSGPRLGPEPWSLVKISKTCYFRWTLIKIRIIYLYL